MSQQPEKHVRILQFVSNNQRLSEGLKAAARLVAKNPDCQIIISVEKPDGESIDHFTSGPIMTEGYVVDPPAAGSDGMRPKWDTSWRKKP